MTRVQEWSSFNAEDRWRLAARSLDETDERLAEMEKRLGKIMTIASSALVSTLLACVLIIIDLARGSG